MPQVDLFSFAAMNTRWLAARQAAVAENIANANTPRYRGKDVAPFESVLQATGLAMAKTDPLHLASGGGNEFGIDIVPAGAWDATHSGNNVSLEAEMIKAGEVRRQFALDTAVVKTFHRLFLASLKG